MRSNIHVTVEGHIVSLYTQRSLYAVVVVVELATALLVFGVVLLPRRESFRAVE